MADTKLKCPACGKVSAPGAFDTEHKIEALEVDYVGGGRGGKGGGFAWSRRKPTPDELELLHSAIIGAEERIAAKREIPPLGEEVSPPDIRKLRKAIAKRDEIIRRQRRGLLLAADKIEQLQRR